jgi:hypothetical protein
MDVFSVRTTVLTVPAIHADGDGHTQVGTTAAEGGAPVPRRQYEFRVSGKLSERAQHAVGDFCEVRILPAPPETIIYGAVTDQVQLHGFLAFLESLGLQIVSVQRIPEETV